MYSKSPPRWLPVPFSNGRSVTSTRIGWPSTLISFSPIAFSFLTVTFRMPRTPVVHNEYQKGPGF